MIEYSLKDLPLTKDQRVLNFCYLSQRVRSSAVGVTVAVLKQGRTHALSKNDWVALMIVQRFTECLLSFELLVALGRERDAGVLLVTLLELSFDLRFVQRHPEAAETWIAHDDRRRKPWRVLALLEDLFADSGERSAMKSIYEHCSMIKHANPSGGTLTLPLAVEHGWLIIKNPPTTDLLRAYTFAAAGSAHETLVAATKIWSDSGFDVGPACADADQAWAELVKLEEKHIMDILRERPDTSIVSQSQADTPKDVV